MCLSSLYKTWQLPKNHIGYKIFKKRTISDLRPRLNKNTFTPEFYGYTQYTLGNEYVDSNTYSISLSSFPTNKFSTKTNYPAGFHIFSTLHAAKLWQRGERGSYIVKVKYDQVQTVGLQVVETRYTRRRWRYCKVIVAKKMQLIQVMPNKKKSN